MDSQGESAMEELRRGLHERELYVDGSDSQVVATVLAIIDNNRYLQDRCRELAERAKVNQ